MFLKFGAILLGIFFCGYVFYLSSARYLKIKDLPDNIITFYERTKYLKILQKYILISGGGLVTSILTFLSPILEIRILLPLICMLLSGYIYMALADEIVDFDISKKDSIIITNFLKEQLNSAQESAKENKIKKIDSDSLEEKLKNKIDDSNNFEENSLENNQEES